MFFRCSLDAVMFVKKMNQKAKQHRHVRVILSNVQLLVLLCNESKWFAPTKIIFKRSQTIYRTKVWTEFILSIRIICDARSPPATYNIIWLEYDLELTSINTTESKFRIVLFSNQIFRKLRRPCQTCSANHVTLGQIPATIMHHL